MVIVFDNQFVSCRGRAYCLFDFISLSTYSRQTIDEFFYRHEMVVVKHNIIYNNDRLGLTELVIDGHDGDILIIIQCVI